MKAIVKTASGVALVDREIPRIDHKNDVLIRVRAAGLCRTDIYVADGTIASKTPLSLGHEFSGVVEAVGSMVSHVKVGDRVSVMPIIPCGACPECHSGRGDICQNSEMLGVDCDGAFAEYVAVPASSVYRIPDTLPFLEGAYSEPVAASLAVLKSGIKPAQKGLIYGENRISELTLLILQASGFSDVTVVKPFGTEEVASRRNSFDYIIETLATSQTMLDMQEMIKPGGTIVLKSRKHQPIEINVNKAVRKETKFSAVNYGDFSQAIDLMASGRLGVGHLFGQTYSIDEFNEFLDAGRSGESKKLFLVLG